jgi:hypothetical protein
MPWFQYNLWQLVDVPASSTPVFFEPGTQISVYSPPDGSVRFLYTGYYFEALSDVEGPSDDPYSPGGGFFGVIGVPDGDIHEILWVNNDFYHYDLSAMAQGLSNWPAEYYWDNAPVATIGSDGNPFGYWSGPEGNEPFVRRIACTGPFALGTSIHELHMDGQAVWWRNNIGATPSPTVWYGRPFGFTDANGVARVVYLGADGHIHQLSLIEGFGWFDDDLFAEVGNPFGVAIHVPTAYVTDDGVTRVIYIDVDYHIHELRNENGWHDADLSQLTNAISAQIVGTPPFPYMTPGDGAWRIVYLGSDGQIQELVSYPGQPWVYNKLWSIQNQDPNVVNGALSGPHAYVSPNGTARVVYVGIDNHIHEFRLEPGGWFHTDLNADLVNGAPGVPADARTTPVGFVTPSGESCVVYLSGWRLTLLRQQVDLGEIGNLAG